MYPDSRARYLVYRYLFGLCDESEKTELYEWIEESTDRKLLVEQILDLAEMIISFIVIRKHNQEEANRYVNECLNKFNQKYNYKDFSKDG